ncbi:MAG: selenocysteine-specific translation elongation factor [Acidobacteria bacterium]|nr:selenocysteine-specific translation elongation factor [Acidobacteriota bacterium]
MKNVIVGTAGHIDHGKSALVLALTGIDPDRLEEEKRRGITIDLGFAHLELGDVRLGFVDVPGHERFVRNMLAGAGGIDVVLLVIAADESIKPQTREHFDICRMLGIERGLVALTKSDLVEPDALGLVRLEVEEFLKGSFLEGAPVVPVSSKIGAGLEQLKSEMQRLAVDVPGKDASRHFRLPIDRSFAMKGFGSVVTGTLVAGSVGVGEEVEVFPQRLRLRVRGLQVHGQPVERAYAGQRTAVNLAGVQHEELQRGMVLAAPALSAPTERVDALLMLLPSARPLKHGTRVHFHQGTMETVAEVRLLDRAQLQPGQEAYAQLRLRAPTLLLPGDRFILRQFSPVITIGGGLVLHAHPEKHRRDDPALRLYLDTLASGHPERVIEALIQHAKGGALTGARLVSLTGWRETEVRGAADKLVAEGKLRRISTEPLVVAGAARWQELRAAAVAAVDAFHKREPLLPGLSKEELRERVFARAAELFEPLVAELVAQKELELAGDLVRRPGRSVTLSREEEEARKIIEQAFAKAGLTVPAVKDVLAKTAVEPKRAQKIVNILVREGTLVKVTEELLFHRAALERLAELLRGYKQKKGERIAVSAFKELTGVTRKYAIPLLEHLDRQRMTRRVGDERLILIG